VSSLFFVQVFALAPSAADAPNEAVRMARLRFQEGVWAVDAGNYISGVTVLAAPVWRTRAKLSHALVAIGIGSALKRAGLPALQEVLLSAARALSNQLCGEPAPLMPRWLMTQTTKAVGGSEPPG